MRFFCIILISPSSSSSSFSAFSLFHVNRNKVGCVCCTDALLLLLLLFFDDEEDGVDKSETRLDCFCTASIFFYSFCCFAIFNKIT